MAQITNNFNLQEFECKGNYKIPDKYLKNIFEVAKNLQVLRNEIMQPIKINSAYRSKEHNAIIGGVKNSQHLKGKAVDIAVKGMKTVDLYLTIERLIKAGEMKQGGLGLYKNFVHYDIRGKKARW
jgi:uncharacterized protein YcbK (DUF882 family)